MSTSKSRGMIALVRNIHVTHPLSSRSASSFLGEFSYRVYECYQRTASAQTDRAHQGCLHSTNVVTEQRGGHEAQLSLFFPFSIAHEALSIITELITVNPTSCWRGITTLYRRKRVFRFRLCRTALNPTGIARRLQANYHVVFLLLWYPLFRVAHSKPSTQGAIVKPNQT